MCRSENAKKQEELQKWWGWKEVRGGMPMAVGIFALGAGAALWKWGRFESSLEIQITGILVICLAVYILFRFLSRRIKAGDRHHS